MSVRPLHMLGSPKLREPAQEVAEVNAAIRSIVQDLFDTMHAANGLGLAANQIGEIRRVAVVDTGDSDPIVLINPVIVTREGSVVGEEGCLSIPEIFGDVERAQRIVVETTATNGERVQLDAEDLKARAVQHEIDHLDGMLFIDHLSPLKRRMLLKKWQKMRKGKSGYIEDVVPAAVED